MMFAAVLCMPSSLTIKEHIKFELTSGYHRLAIRAAPVSPCKPISSRMMVDVSGNLTGVGSEVQPSPISIANYDSREQRLTPSWSTNVI